MPRLGVLAQGDEAGGLSQGDAGESGERRQQEGAAQPGGRAEGTADLAQRDAAHRYAPERPRAPHHLGQDEDGREGQIPSPRRWHQGAGHGDEGRLEEHKHRPPAGVEGGGEEQPDGEQPDAKGEAGQRPRRRRPTLEQPVENGQSHRTEDPEAPRGQREGRHQAGRQPDGADPDGGHPPQAWHGHG